MNTDPNIRKLVTQGHIKLAYVLIGIVVLSIPIILFPGLPGVRVVQAIAGGAGIVLSIWAWLNARWTPAVCLTFFGFSVVSIALAWVVTARSAGGQTITQLLIMANVILILIVLPKAAAYGPKGRQR